MGLDLAPSENSLWRIVQAIISLGRGASNSVGTITLAAGATSTVVTTATSPAVRNVAKGMQVFLTPLTAHAAAVLAQTYVSSVGQQTFTVTHPNDANVDKTFGFEARG